MNKLLKYLVALVLLVSAILIWTMVKSADVAAEFKVREEYALIEIAKADSINEAERMRVADLRSEVDSLETIIDALTESNTRLRTVAQDAVAATEHPAVVYTETDSVLVETAESVFHETNPNGGPLSLCRDAVGVDRFCMPRLAVEDYITMARVTIPAYKVALAAQSSLIASDSMLIGTLREQNAGLKAEVGSLNTIIVMERVSGAQYEGLYRLAESSYRKERRLRKLTLYGAGIIITAIAIFK